MSTRYFTSIRPTTKAKAREIVILCVNPDTNCLRPTHLSETNHLQVLIGTAIEREIVAGEAIVAKRDAEIARLRRRLKAVKGVVTP